MFGIWCKDTNDWLRERGDTGIIVFESKRKACARAARTYGFPSYSAAKHKDWCEVRKV